MRLSDPIESLKGIGEKTAALYHKAGVFSLWELLTYVPRTYLQYPEPVRVSELRIGSTAAVSLTVTGTPNLFRARSLSVLSVVAFDETGKLKITWFNMPYLKKNLKSGMKRVFFGRVEARGGVLTLEHPKMFKEEDYESLKEGRESIYPLVKGLTQSNVRKAVSTVLSTAGTIEDYLSPETLKALSLTDLDTAIRSIHSPASEADLLAAKKRLAFDEFLIFILSIRKLKEKNEAAKARYTLIETAEAGRLIDSLPFALTKAQLKAYKDCMKDMESEHAMMRLVQGDVGSGKTIVALLCLITAAANGCQGAMMAPTEVLAAQHFKKTTDMINAAGLDIKTVLLTGSMSEKEKRQAREVIASGEAQIIIGTHALIQEKVEYKALALVVTDEQHRFGVGQRESFAEKADGADVGVMLTGEGPGDGPGVMSITYSPHVLVMSATPIPRTLAIILYGDLDISVMDEKPEERLPIKNALVDIRYRPKAYEFIKKQVEDGRQGYIICPSIEASETMDMENVQEYSEKLRGIYGDGVRIGVLHGKMKSAGKEKVMGDFAAGNIDVLVSTTVVEVGVDVPNATVMLIEDAQRFGLAQLHQLRGRIGRGDKQSYCIFVDTSGDGEENRRLAILKDTNDGFKIASEDLKLRGPGDMFGIRQSGELGFKSADIYNDADMLEKASAYVSTLSEDAGEGLLNGYADRFMNERVTL